MFNYSFTFNFIFDLDGRAKGDGRESVPGPSVPDRRSYRPHHEDAQNTHTQSTHNGTLQSAQFPRQGVNLGNFCFFFSKIIESQFLCCFFSRLI